MELVVVPQNLFPTYRPTELVVGSFKSLMHKTTHGGAWSFFQERPKRGARRGVLLLVAIFKPFAFLNRGKYRQEIRGLHEQLQRGMEKAQVHAALKSGHYPDLELDGDDDELWVVSTPYEFGARNWVLLIDFEGAHVSALRVRTPDSYEHKYRPAEAPPDK